MIRYNLLCETICETICERIRESTLDTVHGLGYLDALDSSVPRCDCHDASCGPRWSPTPAGAARSADVRRYVSNRLLLARLAEE